MSLEWFQTGLNKVKAFLDEVPGSSSQSEKKWDAAANTISSMDYNPTRSTTLGGMGSGGITQSEEAANAGKSRMDLATDAFNQFKDAGFLKEEEQEKPNFNVRQAGMDNIAGKLGAAPDLASSNPYLSSASRLATTDVSLFRGGK